MNNKIKNYLGVAIIAGVLLVGYAAARYVDAYSKSIQPSSFRSFSASGEGKIVAVPDVAEFTLTVTTQGGKDIGALQTENTAKMNKIIDFIKSKGVADKDIKTQYYNLDPRYESYSCPGEFLSSGEPRPCPPAEIVGYTVNQTVQVKVRDFKNIGDILSGAVQNGANTVSSLSFTIDDQTKLRNDARAQAIAKAREQAKVIARAGGFDIGKLLSIDESYYPTAYNKAYGMGGAAMMEIADAPSAPSIEAGSQEVTANVTLRYEIE